jgi:hypothetical protein
MRTKNERDHLGDLGLLVRIILKWILKEIVCDGVDWIQVPQDRNLWRAVVNTVIQFQIQ